MWLEAQQDPVEGGVDCTEYNQDRKRLSGHHDHLVGVAGGFRDGDHRGQCGAFYHLRRVTDVGWQRHGEQLRQQDASQRTAPRQTEGADRIMLAGRDGAEPGPDAFGEIEHDGERKCRHRSLDRRQHQAGDGKHEIGGEEQEQRRDTPDERAQQNEQGTRGPQAAAHEKGEENRQRRGDRQDADDQPDRHPRPAQNEQDCVG